MKIESSFGMLNQGMPIKIGGEKYSLHNMWLI